MDHFFSDLTVHVLNSLWILLNNFSQESKKIRLSIQTPVIYSMGYFLLASYHSYDTKDFLFNVLIGNSITLYLGWVVCASFLSTILKIYAYYSKIDKYYVSKILGATWVAVAVTFFWYNYGLAEDNIGFYAGTLWGLIGVLIGRTNNTKKND